MGRYVANHRISEKDTIKVFSLDKQGKVIASLYDSGYTNIKSVIHDLSVKGSGWLKKIHEVQIHNIDKEWNAHYDIRGKIKR